MSVKIRMRRTGRRNNPAFRLVVTDSRERRDGGFIEILGHYNPLRTPAEFVLKEERALYWLKKGVGLSDTVKSLFKRQGVLEKFTGVAYPGHKEPAGLSSKKARKKAKAKIAAAEKAAPAPTTEAQTQPEGAAETA